MKRWVFAVFTQRNEAPVFSQMCTVLDAANEFEAYGLAHAIARKLFPPRDGWTAHSVCVESADTVVTLDNAQLLPE